MTDHFGVNHPLALLTPDEVRAARQVVDRARGLGEAAVIAHIVLEEPSKSALARWREDDPIERTAHVLVVPGPELTMIDYRVSLSREELLERTVVEGMRPALLLGESVQAIVATKRHPDFLAALERRGISDVESVQVDPWPAGAFGYAAEAGRRIARCICFVREFRTDNGYARPIEGLLVDVDLGRGEVIEVIDHVERGSIAPVPLAKQHARYWGEDVEPLRSDLRPVSITQPEGPSFQVEGNLVRWQKWQLRLGFHPYEGLVLHQVAYEDAGRLRSILHRASICEMVVPYGVPDEIHGWKNAFDAGEWGLGRMTQPLALGCDCLGEIHYFDVCMANERGDPWVIKNAICMHEEDFGIGWKHVDLYSGSSQVRRSRRLVISNIATVGNYEYGFYWYLYLDGNIQLEVKLTGIMSPMGLRLGTSAPYGRTVAPGVAAPVHQHLFSARLDFDVDGTENHVEEVEAVACEPGPDNPWLNGFGARSTVLERESQARRRIDPAASRGWRVVNASVRNGLGEPVAYKLTPTMSTPTLLAHPEAPIARRAGFARYNLWVTAFHPEERRAAGEFPNQHPGGAGLPEFSAADRNLVDTDVVLWYTFGLTHLPRPEDWPVMPVEYTGFLLSPNGFFDRNPALDVPPSPQSG